MINKIKKLIQDGEMAEAMKSCLDLDVQESLKSEITTIASQFESIERAHRIGHIDATYYEKEMNRIKNSILRILYEVEMDSFESPSVVSDGTNTVNIKYLEKSKHFQKLNKRINNLKYFKDKLIVRDGPVIFPPQLLSSIGKYHLQENELIRAGEIEREQKENSRPNDICAAIIEPPFWSDTPLRIEYHPLYYSEIKALREHKKKVAMYTVNGVIFCEEAKCLLIHRRSNMSDDFKQSRHIFGGAFMPPGFGQPGDRYGPVSCLIREIWEETGFTISLLDETPTITLDEFSIDFVHTAFLGINISRKIKDMPRQIEGTNSKEGHVVEIEFDALENCLKDIESWTPAGWVDIVYWLALNAPNLNKDMRFSGKTGSELAEKLLDFVEDKY